MSHGGILDDARPASGEAGVREGVPHSRLTTVLDWSTGLLVVFAAVLAAASLRWRIEHDLPLLLYVAFAINRLGLVPYRDIFDFNMPGAYTLYRGIGAVSNYSDLGVRCADLAILGATLALSFAFMKPFGRRAATCGAALWAIVYLSSGPSESLQRDALVVPVLLLALVSDAGISSRSTARRIAAAAFWGVAATIKPQAAIGFPVIVAFECIAASRQRIPRTRVTAIIASAAAGFAAPLIGVLIYLAYIGSLSAFTEVVTQYLPLYAHLSGGHTPLSGLERAVYVLRNVRRFSGAEMLPLLCIPAVVGAYAALHHSRLGASEKRRVTLLLALAACYWVYPVISGAFWPYHWFLCTYFVVQLSSLCVAFIATVPVEFFASSLSTRAMPPPKDGRVDAIAQYLASELREGDTVQPLDWTGGAVHAMLIARAKLATPFLYDFYFYYDVSNPYVQELRRRFIDRMRTSRPRFIVDVLEDKAWVNGPDTTVDFPELRDEIASHYRAVHHLTVNGKDDVVVYERLR
jgi:hypothetical protein